MQPRARLSTFEEAALRLVRAGSGFENRKPWAHSQPSGAARRPAPPSRPLRDHVHPRGCAPMHHDGADDRTFCAVRLQAADERAVDLEDVDREALQVAERRVAGAEVVERAAARPGRCSSSSRARGVAARP